MLRSNVVICHTLWGRICITLLFAWMANAKAPDGIAGLGESFLRQAMDQPNSTIGGLFKGFQELVNNPAVAEVAGRAVNILANGLDNYVNHYNYTVSLECLRHTEMTLRALVNRESWALRMIDAMGKPHSDLIDLHLIWLGSYDECIATEASLYPDTVAPSPFKGRYCMTTYTLTGNPAVSAYAIQLKVGLCVPNTCNADDTKGLSTILMSLIPVNTSNFPEPTSTCQLESLEYTTSAIAAITVAAAFIVIIIAGTIYDVAVMYLATERQHQTVSLEKHKTDKGTYITKGTPVCTSFTILDAKIPPDDKLTINNVTVMDEEHKATEPGADRGGKLKSEGTTVAYKHGVIGKILMSFSLYTNLGRIMNTRQASGTLTAVHGIRFISMSWVILGHAVGNAILFNEQTHMGYDFRLGRHYFLWLTISTVALTEQNVFLVMYHRLTFQGIANATFSVDTFFALSGLLVAYLSLKEMKKVGGAKKFKWGMYYFHRFWRLTPAYMLTLLVYVPTMKYWSNGPMWNQKGLEVNECRDSWWHNLLYINNLVDPAKQCMQWSWYLANDMQFYVISPLVLIPLYYSRIWGSVSCFLLLMISVISSGVVTAKYDLSSNVIFDNARRGVSDLLYVKPWCRVGPYAVGMFTGYLLYTTRGKIRMRKVVALLGWTVATVTALLVLYGLWNRSGSGAPTLNKAETILYNATSRSVWGICVCWVVFACATGHGGPVNTFLSWKAFIPLSRLSYCAYMVHLIVILVKANTKRSLLYYTDIEAAYIFTGTMCMSYAAALVVSLAFEAPMMGLEKAFLGRDKRS